MLNGKVIKKRHRKFKKSIMGNKIKFTISILGLIGSIDDFY